MIALFVAGALSSPLQITHDIRDKYLYQKGIVITIHVHNPSDQSQTIPDLASQTWRTSFSLRMPNGQKETRSNEKKPLESTWVIPPKTTRAVTLEIPRSSKLKKGKYQLTLSIDYQLETHSSTHQFEVLAPKEKYVDISRTLDGTVRALWTDQATLGTYLHTGTQNIYQQTLHETPQLCITQHLDHCAYNIQNRVLNIFMDNKTVRAPIAYQSIIPQGRLSFAFNHYFLPIQTPQQSLLLMQIDPKGVPSFRKLRSNIPEIQYVDTALSSIEEPLYLISHKQGVEFFRISEPAKNRLPLNTRYIHKNTQEQEILSARFGIHPEEGFAILITYREQREQYNHTNAQWYTTSGKTLGEAKNITLPAASIVDAFASPPAWLSRTKDSLIYTDLHASHTYKTPKNSTCTINKKGVVCFSQGEWNFLHRNTQEKK